MTANLTPETALALLQAAALEEIGVALPCEAVYHDRAKMVIYKARESDPSLAEIMICGLPNDDEIWFVKKSVEVI